MNFFPLIFLYATTWIFSTKIPKKYFFKYYAFIDLLILDIYMVDLPFPLCDYSSVEEGRDGLAQHDERPQRLDRPVLLW